MATELMISLMTFDLCIEIGNEWSLSERKRDMATKSKTPTPIDKKRGLKKKGNHDNE